MDDDSALPQRPNARRRMRAALQQTEPSAAGEAICAPTSLGQEDLAGTPNGAAVSGGGFVCGTAPLRDGEGDRGAAGAAGLGDPGNPPGSREGGGEGGSGSEGGGGSEGGSGSEGEGSGEGEGGDDLPAYRSAAVGQYKFEYLDHTADVQLHAWGRDLTEAFENCALAMFNYMSPLEHVRPRERRSYRAEGHDLPSLLYGFLDELLFVFSTELFLAASLTITSFDRTNFVIEAEGSGEAFDRDVHEVGTEIKAITYSAMSISERPDDAEVFVIVDI